MINEECDKKTRKLGRAEIDLARYAHQAVEKGITSFSVKEAISKDLAGDEKDKPAAADAMKLTVTLNFACKSLPAEYALLFGFILWSCE